MVNTDYCTIAQVCAQHRVPFIGVVGIEGTVGALPAATLAATTAAAAMAATARMCAERSIEPLLPHGASLEVRRTRPLVEEPSLPRDCVAGSAEALAFEREVAGLSRLERHAAAGMTGASRAHFVKARFAAAAAAAAAATDLVEHPHLEFVGLCRARDGRGAVEWLVRHGVDKAPNRPLDADAGYTPLHYAANYGCLAVSQFLVENCRAALDARSVYGGTPLHHVARSLLASTDGGRSYVPATDTWQYLVGAAQRGAPAAGVPANPGALELRTHSGDTPIDAVADSASLYEDYDDARIRAIPYNAWTVLPWSAPSKAAVLAKFPKFAAELRQRFGSAAVDPPATAAAAAPGRASALTTLATAAAAPARASALTTLASASAPTAPIRTSASDAPGGVSAPGGPSFFAPAATTTLSASSSSAVDAKSPAADFLLPPLLSTLESGTGSVAGSKRKGMDESADDGVCSVCMSKPANTIVYPCRHCIVCSECSLSLAATNDAKTCVRCRAHIERVETFG